MNLKDFDFRDGGFIIGYHLLLIVLLPIYVMNFTLTSGMITATVVLFILTGLSVTAGYHRLFSHKCYKTNKVIEAILLFFGTMSVQGSAIWWSHEHRIHHRFADQEKDPYNINKGFWYAHIFWLFKKKSKDIDPAVVPDLLENKLLVFQHKHFAPLMIATNLLAIGVVGFILNDYFGAFVFAGLLRMFAVHHCTWFINSLAHTFGSKPYSQEQSAVNNAIISLLTFGEGYHNYHHAFASDYRNGIRWWQFDPTKWLIWILSKVGLTNDLKRVDAHIAKRKILNEDKRIYLDALEHSASNEKQRLQGKVHTMFEALLEKVTKTKDLIIAYQEAKKQNSQTIKPLREDLKLAQSNLKIEWKNWMQLGREINKIAPLQHHH